MQFSRSGNDGDIAPRGLFAQVAQSGDVARECGMSALEGFCKAGRESDASLLRTNNPNLGEPEWGIVTQGGLLQDLKHDGWKDRGSSGGARGRAGVWRTRVVEWWAARGGGGCRVSENEF